MVSITLYGGVGVIGGNKVLLEDGDTRLFFDFGTDFEARGRYFEEFLAPRTPMGLLDHLEMGLLPPLEGAYRPDLTPPGDLWSRYRERPGYRGLESLDGVLLSHAHMDHSGAISFLRGDVPVYATAVSAFIAKAIQDSASGSDNEVVYWNECEEDDEGLLKRNAQLPFQRRPYALSGAAHLSAEAEAFWKESPRKKKGLIEADVNVGLNRAGSLAVRPFPVDHSIPGACAWAVETSAGWVVYTGDLRIGVGAHAADTQRFIEGASGLNVRALLCEGTSIPVEDGESHDATTEARVREVALAHVRDAAGRLVIADFGPRNVERLLTFREVARAVNRKLVITPKDAYLLDAMRLVTSDVPDLSSDAGIMIYRDTKVSVDATEERIRDRYGRRMVRAADVRSSPGDFVLCFSFWDVKNLIDIQPNGGLYVYSSSEAYSEDQMMDIDRLRSWLDHFEVSGVGLPERTTARGRVVYRAPEPGLHASGHSGPAEILAMVRQIAPRTVIPIHTQNPRYFVEALRGSDIEVIVPVYGAPIAIH